MFLKIFKVMITRTLRSTLIAFFISFGLWSCDKEDNSSSIPDIDVKPKEYTSWIVGDTTDVIVSGVLEGTVLAGGGLEPDAPMKWMLERAKGGDIVVIRIGSGEDGYNNYFFKELGIQVNSVETILLNSKKVAQNADVNRKVRNAECLFFTGGDQSEYYTQINGTPLEESINYLKNSKKITVGGNSAGCAIQGEYFFSAENLGNSSLQSADALNNPYDNKITIRKDFMQSPFLGNLITDTHYNNPDRKGRHLVFMAKMSKDYAVTLPKGIGIEEKTVVCVDENGKAKVFGSASAYFIAPNFEENKPESCEAGKKLTWDVEGKALKVYEVKGTNQGDRFFDVANWVEGQGGVWKFYSVKDGLLQVTN
jgi:cyanophycinase-like exopeptidase